MRKRGTPLFLARYLCSFYSQSELALGPEFLELTNRVWEVGRPRGSGERGREQGESTHGSRGQGLCRPIREAGGLKAVGRGVGGSRNSRPSKAEPIRVRRWRRLANQRAEQAKQGGRAEDPCTDAAGSLGSVKGAWRAEATEEAGRRQWLKGRLLTCGEEV